MSTRMLWFCILTCAAFGVGGIGQSHAKAGSVYDEDDDALLYQGGTDVSLHADRIAQAVAATKPAFFDLLVFHLYREQDLGRFEQLINAAQEKVQTLRQVYDDVKKALTPAPPAATPIAAMPTSTPATMPVAMPTPTPSAMPVAMPPAAPMPTPLPETTPQSMPTAMPMATMSPTPEAAAMPVTPAPMEAVQATPAPDQSAAMMMTAMGTMQPTMPAQMTMMPSSGMPEAMPSAPPVAAMPAP